MNSNLGFKQNIKYVAPFFWVKNMENSLSFYVDGLGFTIKKKWIDRDQIRWCELERGGANIIMQEFWKTGQHANLPDRKIGLGVSKYFIYEDALTIYEELNAREILVSVPLVGNGMWDTQVTDPDGYIIHFESYTNAEEGIKYTENK